MAGVLDSPAAGVMEHWTGGVLAVVADVATTGLVEGRIAGFLGCCDAGLLDCRMAGAAATELVGSAGFGFNILFNSLTMACRSARSARASKMACSTFDICSAKAFLLSS